MLKVTQTLISYSHCVNLSATAHLLLSPCPLEPNRSSLASLISFHAQLLISHLHCVLLSPNTCFYSHQVNSSLNACCLPPPYLFEHKCSSLTPNISIQAQMLAICLHHFYSSANAHLSPPMYPFEPECSSSTSMSI